MSAAIEKDSLKGFLDVAKIEIIVCTQSLF